MTIAQDRPGTGLTVRFVRQAHTPPEECGAPANQASSMLPTGDRRLIPVLSIGVSMAPGSTAFSYSRRRSMAVARVNMPAPCSRRRPRAAGCNSVDRRDVDDRPALASNSGCAAFMAERATARYVIISSHAFVCLFPGPSWVPPIAAFTNASRPAVARRTELFVDIRFADVDLEKIIKRGCHRRGPARPSRPRSSRSRGTQPLSRSPIRPNASDSSRPIHRRTSSSPRRLAS